MYRRIGALVAAVIVLIPAAAAIEINVSVRGKIGGYVEYFDMDDPVESVQKFSVQWYNSESASCRSRMEFRIYEYGSEGYETVWSGSKNMFPGSSDSFEAYWLPEREGNYSVKMVIRHCHDLVETGLMNFSVRSVPRPEESIDISAENVPGRKIRVTLFSESYSGKVVVIPDDYPIGWIFAGKSVDMEPGKKTVLEMDYEPSVWSEELVSLHAVSADGSRSSEKFELVLKEDLYFWEEHGLTLFALVLTATALSLGLNFYLLLRKRSA